MFLFIFDISTLRLQNDVDDNDGCGALEVLNWKEKIKCGLNFYKSEQEMNKRKFVEFKHFFNSRILNWGIDISVVIGRESIIVLRTINLNLESKKGAYGAKKRMKSSKRFGMIWHEFIEIHSKLSYELRWWKMINVCRALKLMNYREKKGIFISIWNACQFDS